MLRIRRSQMQQFEQVALRHYEDRMLQTIAKAHPERYEQDGEDRMRVLVQVGVHKCEYYGITDDDDVEHYILLLIEWGLDFEQAQGMMECLEVLEDKDLPGDAKVSLIRKVLNSEGG
jgi:hypothetical protein